jgi:hypothetical protein
MTKLTSNIAQGRIYHAALIAGPHGGLVVERKGRRGGAMLPTAHPQYAEYVAAIRTAVDADEIDALCRAIVN